MQLLFPTASLRSPRRAFKGCKVIRSVTVPEGVRAIGQGAFWGCSQLEKVVIHSHVLERIGEEAFYDCAELVHFYMAGNRLRTISDKLFESCRKLEMIELPESICEIGNSSFSSTALKAMNLPASLQKIGDFAFSYSGLEQVELPAKLTSLGTGAFRHCNFTTIRIPSSVDTLAERVFSDCENLESVENEGSIRSIERGAFSGCKQLKSVQVAYGACLDPNKIFNDNPKSMTAYGETVSISEPTRLHCKVWDPIQKKRTYYSARFIPVPRGN